MSTTRCCFLPLIFSGLLFVLGMVWDKLLTLREICQQMRTYRLLLILCILPFLNVGAQNSNYYVTPKGTGDGSTWEKALNTRSFMGEFSKEAHQKDTFHLAEGAYLLKPADALGSLMVNLKGGYVAAEEYSVRDPFSNQSVISGSVSTKESECLTVQVKAPENTEITLDGVVLESAADESVVVTSSGEGSSVVLKGCILRKAAPNVCDDQLEIIDTAIYLGMALKELPDASFEKIGRFIKEVTTEGEDGCNQTTRYVVSVLPKPASGTLNYYVKQNGTGDGSSWENAMSDTAFAYAFGRVEEGATFHLAAGNYFPYCDSCYINPYLDGDMICRRFYSNKLVNLVGGYPEDATGAAVADTSNHTIFCTRVKEGSAEYNTIRLLYVEPANPGDMKISGVDFMPIQQFRGMSADNCALRVNAQAKGVTLTLNQCRFPGTGQAIYTNSCAVRMEVCEFGSSMVGIYGADKDEVEISGCSGKNCELTGGKITISNTTFNDMTIISASVANVVNATFVDLTCSETVNAAYLVGNIVRNLTIRSEERSPVVTSSYNLFGKAEDDTNLEKITSSRGDIIVDPMALDSILDSDEDGIRMAYNRGAFTRTIALVSDQLPDGRSIRYSRQNVSEYEVDQCGSDRPETTCPGAYEFQHDATALPMVQVDESVTLSEIMRAGYTTRFYDALGRCVTQTQSGWDDFRANCPLPKGHYLYVVITTEGKSYGGKVTIE